MANPISINPRPSQPKPSPEFKGGPGGKITDQTPRQRLDLDKPQGREEKKGGPIGKEDCFDLKAPDLDTPDLKPRPRLPKLPDRFDKRER
ncbi:MAG: hypothetical protein JNM17_09445 [Archangium sp.]|nr:hypothetical protein [Archangium sp.]